MKRVINVYKKCGQTPLDCINKIKKKYSKLAHLPLTYAGRLDPLAEGVLLILIGDECLKKDEYLKLSKEYEVTILFGFATDTYDLMGRVISSLDKPSGLRMRENEELGCENLFTDLILEKLNNSEVFKKILSRFIGRIKQFYPPYSSRTVDGKPLYKWAREGKLNEIIIPSHDVLVENIEIIKEDLILGKNLLDKIRNDISQVKGDFRQKEIISIWENYLKNKKEEKYKIITLKIVCGSGLYVRGIAHEIGIALGIPALAFKIIRTKVGEYEINK